MVAVKIARRTSEPIPKGVLDSMEKYPIVWKGSFRGEETVDYYSLPEIAKQRLDGERFLHARNQSNAPQLRSDWTVFKNSTKTNFPKCSKKPDCKSIELSGYLTARVRIYNIQTRRDTLSWWPVGDTYPWQLSRESHMSGGWKYAWVNDRNSEGIILGDNYLLTTAYVTAAIETRTPYFRWPEALERERVEPYLKGHESINGLVTGALADINSKYFDLATTIGEASETIGYVVSKLVSLARLLKNAKKELSKLKDTDAASLWLEYRYAIMPLVYSIEDGLELLAKRHNLPDFLKEKARSVKSYENLFGFEGMNYSSTHRVMLKANIGHFSNFQKSFKMNWASTAWELVTLSFVWDWVLNVGDVLSAYFGDVTMFTTGTYSIKVDGTFETDTVRVETQFYHRTVIDPKNYISLTVRPEMNWKRWADAIALVKVILLSKK